MDFSSLYVVLAGRKVLGLPLPVLGETFHPNPFSWGVTVTLAFLPERKPSSSRRGSTRSEHVIPTIWNPIQELVSACLGY